MNVPQKPIYYSDKYCDDMYEYRHVVLPKDMVPLIPKNRLMTESEWREMGVQQSQGWVHYMIHSPEPHILLFKRPKPVSTENGVSASSGITTTATTITTTTTSGTTKQTSSKLFV